MQLVPNWFEMREVYASRVFLISSSVLETTVTSMISDVSDLFSPPATFIVRWVHCSCPGYSQLFSYIQRVNREVILCFTICVHSATRHNISMYPYFLFAAIHLLLKSSVTFSVRPRSSVSRVTVDLIWSSWVRFPPKSEDFFST